MHEKADEASKSICKDLYNKYGSLDRKGVRSIIRNHNQSQITKWIHLSDAVETGSISPLEAWDTIALGYVAEHLMVRRSRYMDRI